MPPRIRRTTEHDRSAVRAVHEAAFPTSLEADLVEALLRKTIPVVSLVAELDAGVVGHILLSPVSLTGNAQLELMGLAPMAVTPAHQRRGIGSALVREGLSHCRRLGTQAVVVLGHPEYYPRFGFVPASRYSIRSQYDVPDDAFMIVELQAGSLKGVSGLIRYDEAFPRE